MLHVRGLHATYEAYDSKVLQGSWPEETEPADCAEATACDALLERWELRVLIVRLSANAFLPTPFCQRHCSQRPSVNVERYENKRDQVMLRVCVERCCVCNHHVEFPCGEFMLRVHTAGFGRMRPSLKIPVVVALHVHCKFNTSEAVYSLN